MTLGSIPMTPKIKEKLIWVISASILIYFIGSRVLEVPATSFWNQYPSNLIFKPYVPQLFLQIFALFPLSSPSGAPSLYAPADVPLSHASLELCSFTSFFFLLCSWYYTSYQSVFEFSDSFFCQFNSTVHSWECNFYFNYHSILEFSFGSFYFLCNETLSLFLYFVSMIYFSSLNIYRMTALFGG